MEPVFDQSGRVVAWLWGERLVDPEGRHVAFLRRNWVLTYNGEYIGRLYACWFRDLTGAAVAFIQGAVGLPQLPAVENPPPPPQPRPALVPPVPPFPPSTTAAMPVWSRGGWRAFLAYDRKREFA